MRWDRSTVLLSEWEECTSRVTNHERVYFLNKSTNSGTGQGKINGCYGQFQTRLCKGGCGRGLPALEHPHRPIEPGGKELEDPCYLCWKDLETTEQQDFNRTEL